MSDSTGTRPRYLAVTVTASGATFLAMLDSTVTNLVVPALRTDFPAASTAGLTWVVTAYAVTFAALLAVAGRFSDLLGRRTVFLMGVGLFTLMSLVCAIAPNLPVLVAGRALQGVGAAAMIPAALAILLLDGPPDGRRKAIGLWSASSAIAAAVGPSVGGVLVELLGWRSVFYVNLPLGLLMIAVTLRVLPRRPVAAAGLPDIPGTIMLAGGVAALAIGVTQAAEWGWLDLRTIACLVGGLAAVVAAIRRSGRSPVPAVDTELWANPAFRITNVVSLLYGMAQFPWLLGTVLYITDLWRYSELEAGFAMTPGAVFASAVALLFGRLTGRFGGPRVATLLGLLGFLLAGVWMVVGLTQDRAFLVLLLPAMFLAGSGMGAITFGTSMAAAMSAPPIRFASASGMNTMARQFGGALGVAALAVILSSGSGLSAYRGLFAFCTVLVAVALVLAWTRLRLTPPTVPPPVTPTPIVPSEPKQVTNRAEPPVGSPSAPAGGPTSG